MKSLIIIAVFTYTLLLGGCSLFSPQHKRTAFLDLCGYERSKIKETRCFETIEGADLSRYEKILLPDITVLPNTKTHSAGERVLHAQIASYATAAYRHNIAKSSANYNLVDVPQADAIILQIAISMVEVHPEDKAWDDRSALAFSLSPQTLEIYQKGEARILIEARISDAISGKLLANSAHVVMEEVRLHGKQLQFHDLQAGLDKWLNEAVVKH